MRHIKYSEFKPDIRLQDYIKSYWHFQIQTATKQHFDILPDGYFDLVIVINNGTEITSRLTGIWLKSVNIDYSSDTEVIGIRFKPLAIGNLIGYNIKSIINTSETFEIKDIGLNLNLIFEKLKKNGEPPLDYLNEVFLHKLFQKETDYRLLKCFEVIEKTTGTAKVNQIAQNTGLSARQLHRLVNNMIGIGVKDYSKIIRFKNTLSLIRKNNSDFFHYYDQSHFIREIKQFTGLTPEKLKLQNNDRFLQYYDFHSS